MAALAKKLLHVCITVPDLDEAVRFYQGVLGFESIFETVNASADGNLLGLNTEEIGLKARHVIAVSGAEDEQPTEINLVEYTEPTAAGEHHAPNQIAHFGLSRLALLVDDIDEAFSKIRAHQGVEIVCAPKDIVIEEPGGSATSRWFSFTDPFGVFITVTAPSNQS